MKVLFFVDDLKGGAGNVVQLLSMELKRRNHSITICCLGGRTPSRYNLEGVVVHRLPSSHNKGIRYVHHVIDSRNVIKREKPDCIVSFLFGVSAFVNLAILGLHIPLIVSERSDPHYLKPTGLLLVLTELAYKRAKSIVVLFDGFKDIAGNRYRDKVVVIPNPVPKIEIARLEPHDFQKEIHFVTIANDTPPKGLDILVSAFSIVCKKYPNAILRIYGYQKDENLKNMITEKKIDGNIQLMGYTLDVKEPLSWADVYVMPSRHEGFPNSLCEAMSAGKCCIATLCHEGIKDLIEDEVNGLLTKVNDVEALAEKISYIIDNSDKIQKIGGEAENIYNKYNLNLITDMWEHEIKKHIIL